MLQLWAVMSLMPYRQAMAQHRWSHWTLRQKLSRMANEAGFRLSICFWGRVNHYWIHPVTCSSGFVFVPLLLVKQLPSSESCDHRGSRFLFWAAPYGFNWMKSHSFFESTHICIAPAAPTPFRATEVEEAIQGKAANDDTIAEVASFAQQVLHPRTSKYRATADYRREMIGVLLQRTLSLAVRRAQSGQSIPEGVGV